MRLVRTAARACHSSLKTARSSLISTGRRLRHRVLVLRVRPSHIKSSNRPERGHHQGSWSMKMKNARVAIATATASALLWTACSARVAPVATTIDGDDISGVVTGANGPEAGVWVIAET